MLLLVLQFCQITLFVIPLLLQYSAQCVSGCVCPDQLVSHGAGKCIPAEDCPCVHNEATYKPGETIKDKCNTWYV